LELTDHETPETLYNRKWAQAVLAQALRRLEAEYAAKGNAQEFACLKGRLDGAQAEISYEEARQSLGGTIEALRMAVTRLRKRYRELVREEVTAPGMTQEDIEDELRFLLQALTGQGSPEETR
jgi:hypothetical protein